MMWFWCGWLSIDFSIGAAIMAGGEALMTTEFKAVAGAETPQRPHLAVVPSIQLDRSRDDLLTDFGKKTLEDRYLLAGES